MRWLLLLALAALSAMSSGAVHDDLIIKEKSLINELILHLLLNQ